MIPRILKKNTQIKFLIIIAILLINSCIATISFAASATVTATGRFVYRNEANNNIIPIKNAEVIMCDNDGILPCWTMASGTTDNNGYFTITGSGWDDDICIWPFPCIYDYPDPLVQVIAESPGVVVQSPGYIIPVTYCFKSFTQWDVQGNIAIDFGEISPENGLKCMSEPVSAQVEDGAWQQFNLANEAYEYMRNFTLSTPGRDIPQVRVFWPELLGDITGASFYRPPIQFVDDGAISITFDDTWNESALMHEYGHHVMAHFMDNSLTLWLSPIQYLNGICDPGHCAWAPENQIIAWSEGWPSFLSEVLIRHYGYDSIPNYETHLYADKINIYSEDSNPYSGMEDSIEGFNTAILWDIFDSDNDDQHWDGGGRRDGLTRDFSTIWWLMVNYDPPSSNTHIGTIHEFWNGMKDVFPNDINLMSEVFREHHIIKPQPDLVISSLSNPPTSSVQGAAFSVSNTVKNNGNENAVSSSSNRYYLSSDATINTTDMLLWGSTSNPPINAGASYSVSTNVSIPETLPPGLYILGACADDPNVIPEENENNNCTASAPIQVQQCYPDLKIQSITTNPINPLPGQNITVTVNIRNQATCSTGGFNLDIYPNLPSPPVLGQFGNPICGFTFIGSGAEVTCIQTVNYVNEGNYNLWAQVDADGVITESNENNNVFGPINITVKAHTLAVVKLGTGKGTVTSSPAGINCGSDCTELYANGTIVYLTATPEGPSSFTGWSGDPDCTDGVVTLDINKTCEANFIAVALDIGIGANGNPGGVNPDVAYNDTDGQFLTVWQSGADIMGEIRDGSGNIIKDDFIIRDGVLPQIGQPTSEWGYNTPAVVYDKSQNNYMVVSNGTSLGYECLPIGCVPLYKYERITLDIVSSSGNVTLNNLLDLQTSWIVDSPDIGINNSQSTAMAVYKYGGGIRGQSINGNVINPNFIIAEPAVGSANDPAITVKASTNNDFMVVYQVNPGSGSPYIAGRLVKPDGTISAEIIISEDITGTEHVNPDVAYNSISNTFLVVWENNPVSIDPPEHKIIGQLLDATGNKLGGNFHLVPGYCKWFFLGWSCATNGDPAIASYTDSINFLVTYFSTPAVVIFGEDNRFLSGTVVDSNGGTYGSVNIFSNKDLENLNPALAYDNQGQFMIAWEHKTSVGLDIYGKLFPGAKTLTITKTGSGNGTVTATGINCGADCIEPFDTGTEIILTATADNGSTFSGWNGDVDCSDGIVTMDISKTCTAVFNITQETFTVTMGGNGSGTVSSSPAGIDCGADCTGIYDYGTTVTLTATAANGSTFDGWSGACSITQNTCTVTMDATKSVTATFTLKQFPLNVSKAGNGTGMVTSLQVGINCGADCTESYNYGTVVTLTATTTAGSTFTGWSGDCTGTESTTTVTIDSDKSCIATFTLPDLIETQVSDPPATAVIGGSFSVTDTVKNQGNTGAGASTTRYYLSTDTLKDSGDILLTGSRSVPSLSGGATSSGTVSVTIPSGAVAGTSYYLLACSDDTNTVPESDEANNCVASGKTIETTLPDLVETEIVGFGSYPVPSGSSHAIRDTTINQGTGESGASATRYYLSRDTLKDSGDILLTGNRSVPSLAAGATSSGYAVVIIPVTTTPDSYYILACADDANTVAESNENNNCRDSGSTQQITGPPDLIELSVSAPPANAAPGTTFTVTDTVKNQGSGNSGAFNIRYYLSANTIKDDTDILLLGGRSQTSLSAGSTANGSADVIILSTTALGTYYLLACADDLNEVGESDETNNCSASSGTLNVTDPPDLIETYVSNPPPTAAPGSSFPVTDTVKNQGIGPATGFNVVYFLDTDRVWGGYTPLSGIRSVVTTLLPDGTSTGTANVTVTPITSPGSYYLWACVNTPGDTNTGNNCIASDTTIAVTAAPDLMEMWVTTPIATAAAGDSLTVTDTVTNIGNVHPPDPFVIGYYLSLTQDFIKDSTDIRLNGSRMVTDPLMPMSESTGSVSVTIPLSVPPGIYYYLLACADDTNVVAESSEINNCMISGTTIMVTPPQLPDLIVKPFVSNPPSTAAPGDSFSVTDTVTNIGSATAGPSITRYYLSANFIKDGMDTLLTGSRSVGSLAPMALSTGSTTVTIPSSMPSGTYYLLACADDTNLVTEMMEGATNCIPSPATVMIGNLTTNILTANMSGTGSGTVTSSPAGINCGADCSEPYNYGTVVTLTATAATGSIFTGWSGACSGTGTCTVTMDAAKSVTATYTLIPYTLTVSKSGNGSGTVISSPVGINCGVDCTEPYNYGTVVTLTATAATGSTFYGWSGACSGTGTCAVTMDAAKSVTATFTLNQYTLTVNKFGNGTVLSTTPGINCGVDCTELYDQGTMVTLNAVADFGYTFTGWSGACSGTATTCTVTMDSDKSATATFVPIEYYLTVNKTGTGSGTVTSSPVGIDCGAYCTQLYSSGTVVTLTAASAINSTFGGWSGACSGTATTCVVTMDAAKWVTATFNTTLPFVSLAITPDSTSIPRGGTLGYNVTLTNNTSTTQTFKYWTYVTLPNNSRYPATGELFGPVTVTLTAGQTKSAHLTHTIPTVAPLGTYTYHAQVGPYPAIWDTKSFTFNVTSSTSSPQGEIQEGWKTLENGLTE